MVSQKTSKSEKIFPLEKFWLYGTSAGVYSYTFQGTYKHLKPLKGRVMSSQSEKKKFPLNGLLQKV